MNFAAVADNPKYMATQGVSGRPEQSKKAVDPGFILQLSLRRRNMGPTFEVSHGRMFFCVRFAWQS